MHEKICRVNSRRLVPFYLSRTYQKIATVSESQRTDIFIKIDNISLDITSKIIQIKNYQDHEDKIIILQ